MKLFICEIEATAEELRSGKTLGDSLSDALSALCDRITRNASAPDLVNLTFDDDDADLASAEDVLGADE